jgi:hypothetical protein
MPPMKEVVDQCLGEGGLGGNDVVVIGMGVVGFSLDVVVGLSLVDVVVVLGVVGSGEGDNVVVVVVLVVVVVGMLVVLNKSISIRKSILIDNN